MWKGLAVAKSRKEQLEDLLRDDPNDPFLRYGLAMEYISSGDDDEAVRRFEALTAVAPEYVPAYLQRGQALLRLGRDEEAGKVLAAGVLVAQKVGDSHAAGEMQGLLDAL